MKEVLNASFEERAHRETVELEFVVRAPSTRLGR
jgi:hypothetical protein